MHLHPQYCFLLNYSEKNGVWRCKYFAKMICGGNEFPLFTFCINSLLEIAAILGKYLVCVLFKSIYGHFSLAVFSNMDINLFCLASETIQNILFRNYGVQNILQYSKRVFL